MKSVWFDSVKRYYDMRLYTDEQMKMFVKANMITAEEYKVITGKVYAV